jgi:hypothetical protein
MRRAAAAAALVRSLALAGVLAAVLVPSAGASAAATPRWHVYLTSRLRLGPVASDITATGRHAAWVLAWDRGPLLLHWNGSGWHRQSVPGGRQFGPYQVQVTSDGSVWVSGVNPDGQPIVEEKTGGAWHAVTVPPGTSAVAPLSATTAWGLAATEVCSGTPLVCEDEAWQLSDGIVQVYPVPDNWETIASVGSHVWILSQSGVIYSANNIGLHAIASPGRLGEFPRIAPTARGGLWALTGYVHRSDLLEYWNGRHWTKRTVPARRLKLTYGSGGFVWDDHAGVWLGPYAHWTGRRWIRTVPSAPTAALNLLTVTAIPGSASAWAVGINQSGRYVLALYGRKP